MKPRTRKAASLSDYEARGPQRQNQRGRGGGIVALAALLLLSACAREPAPGSIAVVEGFAGLVAADEPRAAVVGRNVLANNGTAADAAVAMGFAMTASYPSRVGLGGGGTCVVYEGSELSGTSIAFLPQAEADGATPPMLARGLALLHARFGSLRWELLMGPAEDLARHGNPASRALIRDVEAAASKISQDERLANALLRNGEPREVGDRVVLPEVAAALSGLRRRGVAYMTGGPYAERLVEAAGAQGAPLSLQTLRAGLPEQAPARELPLDNDVIMMPAESDVGARLASLQQGQLASAADGQGVPAAGFVVADRFGSAVACSFTQNDLFGSGRFLGDTGVLLPGEPPEEGYGGSMAVGLVANKNIVRVRYGLAASDVDAGAAFVEVLADLIEGDPAETAVTQSRSGAAENARVNAFQCPRGTASGAGGACSVASDPRGSGLAQIAN